VNGQENGDPGLASANSPDSPAPDMLETARRRARERFNAREITKEEFDREMAVINDVSPN
jgi:hypothetical protein